MSSDLFWIPLGEEERAHEIYGDPFELEAEENRRITLQILRTIKPEKRKKMRESGHLQEWMSMQSGGYADWDDKDWARLRDSGE